MRTDRRQRKHARAEIEGILRGTVAVGGVLIRVIRPGRQALGELGLGSNQASALTILLILWVPVFPLFARLAARR
jgi:hypothetical protein